MNPAAQLSKTQQTELPYCVLCPQSAAAAARAITATLSCCCHSFYCPGMLGVLQCCRCCCCGNVVVDDDDVPGFIETATAFAALADMKIVHTIKVI